MKCGARPIGIAGPTWGFAALAAGAAGAAALVGPACPWCELLTALSGPGEEAGPLGHRTAATVAPTRRTKAAPTRMSRRRVRRRRCLPWTVWWRSMDVLDPAAVRACISESLRAHDEGHDPDGR